MAVYSSTEFLCVHVRTVIHLRPDDDEEHGDRSGIYECTDSIHVGMLFVSMKKVAETSSTVLDVLGVGNSGLWSDAEIASLRKLLGTREDAKKQTIGVFFVSSSTDERSNNHVPAFTPFVALYEMAKKLARKGEMPTVIINYARRATKAEDEECMCHCE
jgi:hypothetical protein